MKKSVSISDKAKKIIQSLAKENINIGTIKAILNRCYVEVDELIPK